MQKKQPYTANDLKWMTLALEIAAWGAGHVSPNPMVGCVIVSNAGKKIGQGYHERYGQPHAEVNAIQSVLNNELLEGATVYVSLEPCAHQGKTPPCADMLAALPIKRVVVAMEDPTPEVAGKGVEKLQKAGIRVDTGLMQNEAERLNEFFLHANTYGRPFVTLKIAQTLDGYIAAPDGDSEWVTGKEARKMVHEWRSKYDAVMIGRNTALLDNPRLTVRYVEGRQPKRIVIDGALDLPRDLNLFTDQYEEKTIIITHNRDKFEHEADPMLSMLQTDYFRGATLLVSEKDGHTNLDEALKRIMDQDINSVLVEAGQNLAAALLKNQLVDKVECFIAPKLLGGGTRSVMGLDINRMNEIVRFRNTRWEKVGEDMLFTGYL